MKKRILIAEDDYAARESLTKLATLHGFDVFSVADGSQLVSVANSWQFDLVITDLLMPELNGASAMEILKITGDQTPVIAVTGLSMDDVRPIRERFTKIFHKPIDTNELFEFIKNIM